MNSRVLIITTFFTHILLNLLQMIKLTQLTLTFTLTLTLTLTHLHTYTYSPPSFLRNTLPCLPFLSETNFWHNLRHCLLCIWIIRWIPEDMAVYFDPSERYGSAILLQWYPTMPTYYSSNCSLIKVWASTCFTMKDSMTFRLNSWILHDFCRKRKKKNKKKVKRG
jgi:hypothetical protein